MGEKALQAADVDSDSKVTLNDALMVLRAALGIDKLPESR